VHGDEMNEMELEKKMPVAPQISTYRCYRLFLKDLFAFKQFVNPSFSRRRFAQIAGFKSPNYLQLIIDGKRNLSESTAASLAKAFKFNNFEKELFLALVKKTSARNEKEVQEAERFRLLAIKKFVSKKMPSEQAQILSEWYHMLVRELVLLPNFQPTGTWISKKLFDLVTPEQAEKSLRLLLQSGFLVQENGSYKIVDPVLTAETAHFKDTYLKKYHSDTLKIWSQSLEKMSDTQKEAVILNIPIDSKKIPELNKKINTFLDELIGWLQDEKNADQVIQLGTYVIPFK
jgi:uncharacterized protein (TIGR02147 family)